jgi:hypothetical protein
MNEVMGGVLFAGLPLSFPHSGYKLNLYLLSNALVSAPFHTKYIQI